MPGRHNSLFASSAGTFARTSFFLPCILEVLRSGECRCDTLSTRPKQGLIERELRHDLLLLWQPCLGIFGFPGLGGAQICTHWPFGIVHWILFPFR